MVYTPKPKHARIATLLCLLIAGCAVWLCISDIAEDQSTTRPVEARYVCMVTDRAFDRPQIPIEASGKTYYGCCEMCKSRIASDGAVRQARDPVSGAVVDKATAIIGVREDGSVMYFENKRNLDAYQK